MTVKVSIAMVSILRDGLANGVGVKYKRLADAVCNAGNVLLPLLREGPASYIQPAEQMQPLLKCAKGVGHINVEADNDGVVRSLLCASLLMAGWKVIH